MSQTARRRTRTRLSSDVVSQESARRLGQCLQCRDIRARARIIDRQLLLQRRLVADSVGDVLLKGVLAGQRAVCVVLHFGYACREARSSGVWWWEKFKVKMSLKKGIYSEPQETSIACVLQVEVSQPVGCDWLLHSTDSHVRPLFRPLFRPPCSWRHIRRAPDQRYLKHKQLLPGAS